MSTINTKNNTTTNNITTKEEKENKEMKNINEMINTGININTELPISKNTIELLRMAEEAGIEFDNISMNGSPMGIAMSGDGPREAGIRFMQAVANNVTDPRKAVSDFQNVLLLGAAMKEEGITAAESEEDEIDGVPIVINYTAQRVFVGINRRLVAVADLEDLDAELPEVAVKALLVERAKARIKEMQEEAVRALEEAYDEYDPEEDYYDEYDDDYDDDYDNDTIVMGIRMR